MPSELQTQKLLAVGVDVFQIYWTDEDKFQHAENLWRLVNHKGPRVLDVGCGVGAIGAIWQKRHPDLVVTGVNPDPLQASASAIPTTRGKFQECADLPADYFDVVTFQYALGYMPSLHLALDKAADLLKAGGVLFIYDICCIDDTVRSLLDYRTYDIMEMKDALDYNFKDARVLFTADHSEVFRHSMESVGEDMAAVQLILSKTSPVCYRAVKVDNA